jgi:cellulose synthase operon protein C
LLAAVGRDAEAAALYRGVLERDPNNVFALNNLAWLLAPRPDQAKEALALVEKALAARGKMGELLDTRARVYLTLGDADAAIHDLEEAIAGQPSAVRYFHLALAHQRKANPAAAQLALRLANDRGLSPKALHPSDRAVYEQMLRGAGN